MPDLKGPLVEEIPSSLISAANKEVLEILDKPPTALSAKKCVAYIKITPEEKVKIARYAIKNGNCAAARNSVSTVIWTKPWVKVRFGLG